MTLYFSEHLLGRTGLLLLLIPPTTSIWEMDKTHTYTQSIAWIRRGQIGTVMMMMMCERMCLDEPGEVGFISRIGKVVAGNFI